MNDFASNKEAYEKANVVASFQKSELQPPEKTILEIVHDKLGNMKMLDIGVGAGCTTIHFAPLVQEYVGVDYSENMIKACKGRFPNKDYNYSFDVCDVRSMSIFPENYFDFILFSFNGIDYMCHEDRLKAFSEIQRICQKGSFFCFSTHNLQSIHRLLKIQLSLNPKKLAARVRRLFLLKMKNKNFKKLQLQKTACINDGAERFNLLTYYIKPEEQVQQLRELGFKDIQVFLLDGKEVTGQGELVSLTDFWVYYLCRI